MTDKLASSKEKQAQFEILSQIRDKINPTLKALQNAPNDSYLMGKFAAYHDIYFYVTSLEQDILDGK